MTDAVANSAAFAPRRWRGIGGSQDLLGSPITNPVAVATVVLAAEGEGIVGVLCDQTVADEPAEATCPMPRSRWPTCAAWHSLVIGRDGTREQVIQMYELHLRHSPDLIAALPELAGKRLGCYCKPLNCHGDVLVKLLAEFFRDL